MFWCSLMEMWPWTACEERSLHFPLSPSSSIVPGTFIPLTERGCLLPLFCSPSGPYLLCLLPVTWITGVASHLHHPLFIMAIGFFVYVGWKCKQNIYKEKNTTLPGVLAAKLVLFDMCFFHFQNKSSYLSSFFAPFTLCLSFLLHCSASKS
jgi:hypothetical protein